MAKQWPERSSDLDRTDELPRLDVAAYEEALARREEEPLSNTDSWSVQSLNTAHLPAHYRHDEAFVALQTEIDDWQTRYDELKSRHLEQDERMAVLTSDNARLVEQQQITFGRQQLLEQRLHEESALHHTQLRELQEALRAERIQYTELVESSQRATSELHQRIKHLSCSVEQLRGESDAQGDLVNQRGEQIKKLEAEVRAQEKAAADMARIVAGHLNHQDALETELDSRTSALHALEHVRNELEARGRSTAALIADRDMQLAHAMRELERARASLAARDQAISDQDARIHQLSQEVIELQSALTEASKKHDAARAALISANRQYLQAQEQLANLSQSLDLLESTKLAVEAQLSARDADLENARQEIARHREAAEVAMMNVRQLSQSEQALRGELEQALQRVLHGASERDAAMAQLDEQRSCAEASQEEARQWSARIEPMQQELERLREMSAKLEQQVREQDSAAAAMALVLATTQAEVDRQVRSAEDFERAIRVRDELLATLRHQLQTTQDERGILVLQVEKLRAQATSMAERILQKDGRISTLRAALAAQTEAAGDQREAGSTSDDDAIGPAHVQRTLEPIGHDGAAVLLNRQVMIIGRTEDSDICVPSKLVSRQHARLLVGPHEVVLEDLGSMNGCFVNNQPVKHHVLREADELLIGDRRYRLVTRERIVSVN